MRRRRLQSTEMRIKRIKKREKVFPCELERKKECVSECVCVCVCEREREWQKFWNESGSQHCNLQSGGMVAGCGDYHVLPLPPTQQWLLLNATFEIRALSFFPCVWVSEWVCVRLPLFPFNALMRERKWDVFSFIFSWSEDYHIKSRACGSLAKGDKKFFESY